MITKSNSTHRKLIYVRFFRQITNCNSTFSHFTSFFFSPYFRFVGDDDDDNEITDHKTRKITSSDDLGDYVSEQMTWTPSRADLCNFDATVS